MVPDRERGIVVDLNDGTRQRAQGDQGVAGEEAERQVSWPESSVASYPVKMWRIFCQYPCRSRCSSATRRVSWM